MQINQTIKCQYCGKVIQKPVSYFIKKKQKGYNKFYCSHQCQVNYMKQKRKKNKTTSLCLNCGKEFISQKWGTKKFCSHSCSASYNNKLRPVPSQQQREKTRNSLQKYRERYHIKCVKNNIKENHKIKKICPMCQKEFLVFPCEVQIRTYCSKECYLNDHQHNFRKVGEGGLRKGSGRGKKGWYKGYCCDSSWQLAFVIYNLEHNIKFQRNKEGFEYLINEQKHLYYPDFILEDGTYVQIKGIIDDKNKLKISSFNKPLLILDKEKIKPYLEYVTFKYGKDFIELYEGNPHNLKKNKCIVCGAPCKNMCCSRVCIGKYRAQQRWAK